MNWETIWTTLTTYCIEYAWKIIACIVVLIVGNLLIRLVTKKFLMSKAASRLDPGARSYGRMIARVCLKVLLVVIIVAILGIPVASFVTVIAAAGAAIALAIQGSLSNVASGIILMTTHPFRIGDWIESGGKSGKVIEYGLFYTTIQTIEESNVVIPNSALTSSTIINYTPLETRRTNFTVSAAYGSDAEKVKKVILGAIASDTRILTDPAPFAEMSKMNESSIDFTVRFYTKTEEYWDVWFSIHERIYDAFNENGIHIPFNQLDVHLKQ